MEQTETKLWETRYIAVPHQPHSAYVLPADYPAAHPPGPDDRYWEGDHDLQSLYEIATVEAALRLAADVSPSNLAVCRAARELLSHVCDDLYDGEVADYVHVATAIPEAWAGQYFQIWEYDLPGYGTGTRKFGFIMDRGILSDAEIDAIIKFIDG